MVKGSKHTASAKKKISQKSRAYRQRERLRKAEIEEKLARLAQLEAVSAPQLPTETD